MSADEAEVERAMEWARNHAKVLRDQATRPDGAMIQSATNYETLVAEIERLRYFENKPRRKEGVRRVHPKRAPDQATKAVARILKLVRAAGLDIGGPDNLWVLDRIAPPNGWLWQLSWAGDPPRPFPHLIGSASIALNSGTPGTIVHRLSNGIHLIPVESLR